MVDQSLTPATLSTRRGERVVVWHRRGLRTQDHPALAAAADYETILPLFVFDPQFYTDGLACDSRIRFLHESLRDLDSQYAQWGGRLNYGHGEPTAILGELVDDGWDVLVSREPTGRYGQRRDTAAALVGVEFVTGDGLVRAVDSRRNWSDHVEQWFESEPHEFDGQDVDFGTLVLAEEPITPERIESRYEIEPTKSRVPHGGRTAAQRRLAQFVREIESYPGSISSPTAAETHTSRLSPYLRFGCLSVREVYQTVQQQAVDGRAKQLFISRLYWNRHYTQKLADWAGWLDQAANPVMEELHEGTRDPELLDAWKAGQTGYPMVDASMRCLRETGWLNFRMRAMCASVLCDLFAQPWKPGADWLYYHLIDADPAINYTQFQTQAGAVGTNLHRIYNPRKQVRDNDPDGTFIHQWVPELRELPVAFLDQPEKTPLSVQRECGVDVGVDYPYPVVEYEAARERAGRTFERLHEEAHRALKQPAVARRASLSRRGRRASASTADSGPDDDDAQSSLSEFE